MLLAIGACIATLLPRYSSVHVQRIHGVDDALEVARTDMGVDLCGLAAGMAEECLDVSQVGALFQEVCGE